MGKVNANKIPQWVMNIRMHLPLELKLRISENRIRSFCDHYQGQVYVSFSGGLDSTVLLDLVRSIYPRMTAVFADTGLEFPENRNFVKTIDNVIWVKPKLTFKQVIDKYGYPVVSKKVAQYVKEVRRSRGETATKRLRITGYRTDGSYSPMGRIPLKWQSLIKAPFNISDECCKWLKKKPLNEAFKIYGPTLMGTRATEGMQRGKEYLLRGCNAYDLKYPHSTPLAFWTDDDIREYIELKDLPYSPLYDMGYTRSGCMFCMFGVHLEPKPNRFQLMHDTHPKLFDYCMDKLGCRQVLEFINVPAYPDLTLPTMGHGLRVGTPGGIRRGEKPKGGGES